MTMYLEIRKFIYHNFSHFYADLLSLSQYAENCISS